MEKMHIKIKVDQTKLRNEMHFASQLKLKSHIFKPKKGKGSFSRKQKYKYINN